jgi:hypothetical protein
MASGKDLPFTFQLEDVGVTALPEAMASGKDLPYTFQLEDVGVTSLPEAKISQMDISSNTATEESKNRDYDTPPDGGLFAWLQVLGGWILVLNSR